VVGHANPRRAEGAPLFLGSSRAWRVQPGLSGVPQPFTGRCQSPVGPRDLDKSRRFRPPVGTPQGEARAETKSSPETGWTGRSGRRQREGDRGSTVHRSRTGKTDRCRPRFPRSIWLYGRI
jgi:hypothetical protein